MNPIQYFQWGETFIKPAFHIDLMLGYNNVDITLSRFDFDKESQTNLRLFPVNDSPILIKGDYLWVETSQSLVSMRGFPRDISTAPSYKNKPIKKIWIKVWVEFRGKGEPYFWHDEIKIQVGKHTFNSREGLDFRYRRVNDDIIKRLYEMEFTLPTPVLTEQFLKRFVIILPIY